MQGLHKAIGLFSEDNCEAILAASILLSWQATEWYAAPGLWWSPINSMQAKLGIFATWTHDGKFYHDGSDQSLIGADIEFHASHMEAGVGSREGPRNRQGSG